MILRKSKLFSIVVCIITVLSVLSLMIPKGTYAEENDKSITLVCVNGDTILAGMEWKIYRVGQRSANGQNFVQNEDFAGTQINLRRITADSVNKAAQSYQSYAIAAGIQPVQTGITDEHGEVQFTGLNAGLYLISGKLLKVDSHYYLPNASLIEIKEGDTDLKYDAYPKFEYQVMSGQPRAHIVYKEWEGDEEHLDKRPDHVVVDIYRDEEYYDTVILNEENDWRYRWVDSDGSSSWIVMEKDIPECYEMIIEYDINYRIQNSYTDEPFTTTTRSGAATVTTTTTVNTSISVGQASTTIATTTFPIGNATVTNTRTTTASFPVLNNTETRSRTTTSDTVTVTTATTDTVQSGTATETTSSDNISTETATGTTTNSVAESESTTTTVETETTIKTTTKKSGSGSSGSSGGKSSGGSSSIKLPQTGQLWWPVVPLSIGGVLFVSAGLVMKSRRKSDD
ncbi:MAG: Cna B-type domain-containing protein [Prevotella sp.]|nr:Cna B-type domain-containing protein [Alistipes senegalensis]MCM1357933.1 Cna B-type domain-containing protein [Prevotella sp.]MCM1473486.1 Cna B-type domain-containing protein [Muribaculaceae bacterium]